MLSSLRAPQPVRHAKPSPQIILPKLPRTPAAYIQRMQMPIGAAGEP